MTTLGPRLVIAGTHSGAGKTTVACALMSALRRRGLRVSAAKVGPDYIDPGYHALATGRPGRNLDPWMCGMDAMRPLAGRAARDSDVLVVEGVMGLFDGADDGSPSSTADVAAMIDAPVVLVVDAQGMGRSVAAMVRGYRDHTPAIRIAGVIANRVGTDRHRTILEDALAELGVPLLGGLRRDDSFVWRDRHLGLVPVVEEPLVVHDALDRLAIVFERDCDVDRLLAASRAASRVSVAAPRLPERVAGCRVALAGGPAFSFMYEDNLEALTAAGAELITFDPCADVRLPDGCSALVAGGGFPEVYAGALAENRELLTEVRVAVGRGMGVWAECGGLLWLAERLDDRPMAGIVPTTATMQPRLTLGYRAVRTVGSSPFGPPGTELRGHEFHYSALDRPAPPLAPGSPRSADLGAWSGSRRFVSYLHQHLGGAPEIAAAFVRAVA